MEQFPVPERAKSRIELDAHVKVVNSRTLSRVSILSCYDMTFALTAKFAVPSM